MITSNHRQHALERLEATAFLMSADKNRYKGLFQDLENEYLKDQDNYPRNLNQAYSLLVNWKAPTYVRGSPAGTHNGDVFTQGNQATGSSSSQPSLEHNATPLHLLMWMLDRLAVITAKRLVMKWMLVQSLPLMALVPLVLLKPLEPNC